MNPNMVGPVLEAGEEGQAIVSAIRMLNAAVNVEDHGSYWRVLVPQRCEVTRQAVENITGKTFRLPQDLERIMPAFSGLLEVSSEYAVWAFKISASEDEE